MPHLGPQGQISYFNQDSVGTDSRGLSPKATGLHLEGVGGDTLGSTLALPASWAEVGGANGGASAFAES